jgi:hypothetical protein
MSHERENGNGNGARGWQAFFALLIFIFGNGISYLVFGLHTVSRADFDAAQAENRAAFMEQARNAVKEQRAFDELVGELKAQKLLQGYNEGQTYGTN